MRFAGFSNASGAAKRKKCVETIECRATRAGDFALERNMNSGSSMNTSNRFQHAFARRLWTIAAVPPGCPDVASRALKAEEQSGSSTGAPTHYPAASQDERICDGRPFRVDGALRTAGAVQKQTRWVEADVTPSMEGLDSKTRQTLAEQWTRAALVEHASIASFSRLSLELMAAGGPPELVAAVHDAAIDEIQHARLSFALASAYRGKPVAPSAFPCAGTLEIHGDLASIASATAIDGCVHETLAALIAGVAHAQATDPTVRTVLSCIADDEARHAELAWTVLRWAINSGGAPVRNAVAEVFDRVAREGVMPASENAEAHPLLEAHGRLDAETIKTLIAQGLNEIILPCAHALLAAQEPAPRAMQAGYAARAA
jgi:hypothetical protein